jgi:hypothetical protein
MGRSPCLIPPLTPPQTRNTPHTLPKTETTMALIESIILDTMQAQDNLLVAKVAQSEFMSLGSFFDHGFKAVSGP